MGMKVVVITDSFEGAPQNLKEAGFTENSQIKNVITLGKEYEVYAIADCSIAKIIVLIAENFNKPIALPIWLFSVTDHTIPHDWQCHLYRDDLVSMVMGPSFISQSPESFTRLLEGYPDQRNMFKLYITAHSITRE